MECNMLIRYLTDEIIQEQKDYKQVLIAKLWQSRDPYNFMVGLVGTKKKDKDWNFSEVTLHPEDRIYVKINKWKKNLRDPEFLLYIENQPNGSRKVENKKPV